MTTAKTLTQTQKWTLTADGSGVKSQLHTNHELAAKRNDDGPRRTKALAHSKRRPGPQQSTWRTPRAQWEAYDETLEACAGLLHGVGGEDLSLHRCRFTQETQHQVLHGVALQKESCVQSTSCNSPTWRVLVFTPAGIKYITSVLTLHVGHIRFEVFVLMHYCNL